MKITLEINRISYSRVYYELELVDFPDSLEMSLISPLIVLDAWCKHLTCSHKDNHLFWRVLDGRGVSSWEWISRFSYDESDFEF